MGSAILWWGLSPREPYLPFYKSPEPQSADYHPGGSNCRPQVLASLVGQKATSERDRCAEAAEQHRLQAHDLNQQARAADAAQSGAWTAYETTRIALVGAIGGFLTLVAASFAAYYARRAYLANKKSAELAEQTLLIETRPFLYLDSLDWRETPFEDDGDLLISFTFNVKNSGRLPATNIRLWTSAIKVPRGERGVIHDFQRDPVDIANCPPNVTRKTFEGVYLDAEETSYFESIDLGIAIGLKIVFDTLYVKNKTVYEFRWADAHGMRSLNLIYLDQPPLPGEEPDLFNQDQYREYKEEINHLPPREW